jgi:hypothetical protein
VRRIVLFFAVAAVLGGVAVPRASADISGRCGLPATKPLWIDFADGSVSFWKTFARPGVIAAAANFIYPPRLRAAGAKTVYWDMYLNRNRVGTPNVPFKPADVVARAHKLFDYAAASSACATPVITENELFGASLPTPWTPQYAQYRANVLLYLQTLAARGARPVLLVSSTPYTVGDAGDWWRQVSLVADIVREVYFPAGQIYSLGPTGASRSLRARFRRAAADFSLLGIPTSRLGIMLGFQTTPGRGFGGREGLNPASKWFEVVKLQALAAREVGTELGLGSVWSWGWGAWTDPERDPDKALAACVYLWTRDSSFCNAPKVTDKSFNTSLTEGQLVFARGVTCTVNNVPLRGADITSLARVTGDRETAFSALYARAVESSEVTVDRAQILAAEQVIARAQFHGSSAAYHAALAKAHLSQAIARSIIGDELRRSALAARLHVPAPTDAQISDLYATYAGQPARLVQATPAPAWLGGKQRGFALASFAPERVFSLPTGKSGTLLSLDGSTVVRALGAAKPLSLVPLDDARPAVAAAVARIKRDNAYGTWIVKLEQKTLARTNCRRDDLPTISQIDLTQYAPFLVLP